MAWFCEPVLIVLCLSLADGIAFAQKAPAAPDHPWDAPSIRQQLIVLARPSPNFIPDAAKSYTLSELVDIAEQNNPDTRVAWENAKARAADLGIAKAALYPTLAAAALAESDRLNVLLGASYYRHTTETFSPVLRLDYTIFDFGKRSQAIAFSRNSLVAADFEFNDAHRKIIFQVMHAYYKLLNAQGQQDVAEANLKNAQTVQRAAEARLRNGLATLPDVLEARSATAQADYDLQATIGAAKIAHGNLATALGISPTVHFDMESIQQLQLPQQIDETVEASIDEALTQRPDLLAQVAQLRAATAEVKVARRSYLPTLSIDGTAGLARTYGEQYLFPGSYSPTQETWNARLGLSWTLFDGLAREERLAKAKANEKQVAATLDAVRDQVENDVWSAYSTASTALEEQKAAAALLAAASESYDAALKSYNYGVRSQIDVVSAQEKLAQARTADVTARTDLLTAVAALAFETGDLLNRRGP
jgi:TolC family type I secretion outer membrane protein